MDQGVKNNRRTDSSVAPRGAAPLRGTVPRVQDTLSEFPGTGDYPWASA